MLNVNAAEENGEFGALAFATTITVANRHYVTASTSASGVRDDGRHPDTSARARGADCDATG